MTSFWRTSYSRDDVPFQQAAGSSVWKGVSVHWHFLPTACALSVAVWQHQQYDDSHGTHASIDRNSCLLLKQLLH